MCLTSQCQVLARPNHHLTAAKALPSAHVQRKGARAGRAGVGCMVGVLFAERE
ncbi:hypothetical protein L6475_01960 [Prevotella sp. E9-3]|uniref:hypothetical protein n=1 Tax=Prevotella sp. E9-3 TaxID=2913621 RepID=UPI001EDC0543|nr:hypothetical protein [Prevotella sp. E9-3]UKK48759.1 hypothetical protein L6475_01960 [Prevotella sp. E9-3]